MSENTGTPLLTPPGRTRKIVTVRGARVGLTEAPIKISAHLEQLARERVARFVAAAIATPGSRLNQTYSARTFGTPGIMPRLDCTLVDPHLNDAGELYASAVLAYEVEWNPAGDRFLASLDPLFRARRHTILMQNRWPSYVTVISPSHGGIDINLVRDARRMTLSDWCRLDPANRPLVHPRVRPAQYYRDRRWRDPALTAMLIAPAEEDKSYGYFYNDWRLIRYEDIEALPLGIPFVLKPVHSAWAKDVVMWIPPHQPEWSRYRADASDLAWIKSRLKLYGSMILQPFHPPMDSGIEAFPYRMLRFHFAWRFGGNPQADPYQNALERLLFMGGAHLSLDALSVHGQPTTRTGALLATTPLPGTMKVRRPRNPSRQAA